MRMNPCLSRFLSCLLKAPPFCGVFAQAPFTILPGRVHKVLSLGRCRCEAKRDTDIIPRRVETRQAKETKAAISVSTLDDLEHGVLWVLSVTFLGVVGRCTPWGLCRILAYLVCVISPAKSWSGLPTGAWYCAAWDHGRSTSAVWKMMQVIIGPGRSSRQMMTGLRIGGDTTKVRQPPSDAGAPAECRGRVVSAW
ncbi:hypothetical protein QBC44DRAFT_303579 [Cladorrhinum sp. PSN332]|nr:hypothetical protein QBC44DRAFT_303579 [Cladorrhinum sp. PSN332]